MQFLVRKEKFVETDTGFVLGWRKGALLLGNRRASPYEKEKVRRFSERKGKPKRPVRSHCSTDVSRSGLRLVVGIEVE